MRLHAQALLYAVIRAQRVQKSTHAKRQIRRLLSDLAKTLSGAPAAPAAASGASSGGGAAAPEPRPAPLAAAEEARARVTAFQAHVSHGRPLLLLLLP